MNVKVFPTLLIVSGSIKGIVLTSFDAKNLVHKCKQVWYLRPVRVNLLLVRVNVLPVRVNLLPVRVNILPVYYLVPVVNITQAMLQLWQTSEVNNLFWFVYSKQGQKQQSFSIQNLGYILMVRVTLKENISSFIISNVNNWYILFIYERWTAYGSN